MYQGLYNTLFFFNLILTVDFNFFFQGVVFNLL